jgi:hypothetical protein
MLVGARFGTIEFNGFEQASSAAPAAAGRAAECASSDRRDMVFDADDYAR